MSINNSYPPASEATLSKLRIDNKKTTNRAVNTNFVITTAEQNIVYAWSLRKGLSIFNRGTEPCLLSYSTPCNLQTCFVILPPFFMWLDELDYRGEYYAITQSGQTFLNVAQLYDINDF